MSKFIKKIVLSARNQVWSIRHRCMDRFVFIHINKTGGSSIEKALHLRFEHKTVLEKIEELGTDQWKRRLTFTVIRNPWDKVVSHYCFRVKTNQTNLAANTIPFTEWVKLAYGHNDPFYYDEPRMFMPQFRWITDTEGGILVDFICRFEYLEEDFRKICKKINKNVRLSHLKSSDRGNYENYYDSETKEIIKEWFSEDIDRFGYHF